MILAAIIRQQLRTLEQQFDHRLLSFARAAFIGPHKKLQPYEAAHSSMQPKNNTYLTVNQN